MEFVNYTDPKLAGFGSEYAKIRAREFKPELYEFQGQETLISPAMVFYEDLIRTNMRAVVEQAGGPEHLIPHIKTHKTAEIIRIGLELGLRRVMAATIAEAELAASCGVEMVVISYAMVGPNISRLLKLQETFPGTVFVALGDDIAQLSLLDRAAAEQGVKVHILIDVNPGLNRTGVLPEAVEEFAKTVTRLPHIVLRGLHFYDLNDRALDPEEFRRAVFAQDDMITVHYEKLKKAYGADMLIVGGTPEMEYHVAYPYDDMYYSPGTMALYDWTYISNFPSMDCYRPAAMILSRVISHPAPGYFTLDCGTKALSQDTRATNGLLLGIEHAQPVSQNEEHWIFQMDPGFEEERPAIGKEIFIMPAHICPNMLFYPSAAVVKDGRLSGSWKIAARDRIITI